MDAMLRADVPPVKTEDPIGRITIEVLQNGCCAWKVSYFDERSRLTATITGGDSYECEEKAAHAAYLFVASVDDTAVHLEDY